MLKECLKLSDKQFKQVFGVTKEIGIKKMFLMLFWKIWKK